MVRFGHLAGEVILITGPATDGMFVYFLKSVYWSFLFLLRIERENRVVYKSYGIR